jgi:maltose alpha-D-glucosyltransferase/alpha-amylase
MDPVYGYEAINVEAQERSPFSLLHWMKRLIAVRRQHPVFGRGSIEFITTSNRKVLTYIRRYDREVVLCVANLARTVQPVEIPLGAFAGLTPVEITGQTEFPRIGEQPYFLTLAAYGYYWFQLQESVQPVASLSAPVREEPALVPALFAGVVWDSLMDGSLRTIIERQALPAFLERQRWYGSKARRLTSVRFVDWATLRRGTHPAFLTIVEAQFLDGGSEQYLLPLAMASGQDAITLEEQRPAALLARITGARKGALHDGLFDDGTCSILLAAIQEGREIALRHGRLRPSRVDESAAPLPPDAVTPISRSAPDQSNTSVFFGRALVMKLFRRIEGGPNPDIELGTYLTRREFAGVPPLIGALEYSRPETQPAAAAMLQRYVVNQGNGWQAAIDDLGRYFERVIAWPAPTDIWAAAAAWTRLETEAPDDIRGALPTALTTADVLGRRTGELHLQLAANVKDPAFVPQANRSRDLRELAASMRDHAAHQLDLLQTSLATLDDPRRQLAEAVLAQRPDLLTQFDALECLDDGGRRIRVHGDYHLGQILVAEADLVILDFEGEPARALAERRVRSSPLRDVAGMLRSFSYASLTALDVATRARPEDRERLTPWAAVWEAWVSAAFTRAYLRTTSDSGIVPSDRAAFDRLLRAYMLDKALYELGYELNNRPDWVHIPLQGLLTLR